MNDVITSVKPDTAEVLKNHRWVDNRMYWNTGCSCDQLWWKGYENLGLGTEEMYRAHVADVLAETVIADVWDSAYHTGIHDEFTSQEFDGGRTPPARVNPLRPLEFNRV